MTNSSIRTVNDTFTGSIQRPVVRKLCVPEEGLTVDEIVTLLKALNLQHSASTIQDDVAFMDTQGSLAEHWEVVECLEII